MALKKVLDTSKDKFLTKRFEDEEGNQYSATAAESLISWIRLNRPSPEDLGKNGTTPVYEGDPPGSDFIDADLGEVTYPSVNFSDDTRINISYSNPELYRFSSLESGASATVGGDNPFSMSMWVNLDEAATGEQIFAEKSGAFTFKIKSKSTSDQKTENAKIIWDWIYNQSWSFGSGDYILINVDGTYYGVAFQQDGGDPVDWASGTLGFSINPITYPNIIEIPQSSSWDDVFSEFDSMINSTGVKVSNVSQSSTSSLAGILFEVVDDTIRGEGTNTSNTNISLLVGNVIDEANGTAVAIGNGSPPFGVAIVSHPDPNVSTLDTDFVSGINPSRAGLQVKIYSSNSDVLYFSTNSDIDDSDNLYDSLKNSWNHIAFAYKGGVASSNDDYVKDNLLIYLNGNLIGGKDKGLSFFFTEDDSVPYVSLVPDDSNNLFVGSDSLGSNGSYLLDGSVSEVCVWNSFLTSQDIKAVYNTTKSNFTRNSTYSGFLNHSPRIQSIENINHHYVHDKFDDMRTIDFVDPRQEAIIRFNNAPKDAHTITITDTSNTKTKVFEFQRGVVLGSGNIEVNIKGTRTAAQAARRFVQAVNNETNHNDWSFYAEQTKPNEVKIVRGKIDSSSASTVTLGANTKERFIEIVSNFSAKPQPISVYPSLDLASSEHLAQRNNYGLASRSDIEIVRPVSRFSSTRIENEFAPDPYNESNSHSAFGFEEGIEGVSPERDMNSNFYNLGTDVTSPSSVKSRKKIVIDMPVTSDTDLQMVADSNGTNTNSNFPMAYYNHSENRWESIGLGTGSFYQAPTGDANARFQQFKDAISLTMVGFTPSRGLTAYPVADSSGPLAEFLPGSLFDFSPRDSISYESIAGENPKILNAGSLSSPTNVFGFPAHPKFHATGSQELRLDEYIDKPFVLEKIVFEFNIGSPEDQTMGSLTTSTTSETNIDLDTVTFFILNQREGAVGSELDHVTSIRVADAGSQKLGLEDVVEVINPIGSIPQQVQLTPTSGQKEVKSIRDLVTWSRITASPNNFDTSLLDKKAKDLRLDSSLVVEQNHANRQFGIDRSLEGTPKKYSIASECIAPVVQITSGSIISGSIYVGSAAVAKTTTRNYFGISGTSITNIPELEQHIGLSKKELGRTLADIQSGRSTKGENPSGKRLYTFRGHKKGDVKITAYERDAELSPYVLMPTDKLVIGCQSPINMTIDGNDHGKIRLGQGEGKIILYGYELEKETESFSNFDKSSTGNSNFFSENIGDIHVRDQFDTSPRMNYYRSSIDEVVTGSMQENVSGDDFTSFVQSNTRQVIGRNSQGTQGTNGSLLRGRKLTDQSERYYDSMVPDIANLMSADNVNALDITNLQNSSVVLGVNGADKVYKELVATSNPEEKLIWDNWFSSFPFEPRYNGVSSTRLPGIRKAIRKSAASGATKGDIIKSDIENVAIALFEKKGTLSTLSQGNEGILDNPSVTENTNRLIPGGLSSQIFVNYPTLSDSEVYLAWDPSSYGDGDGDLEPTDADPESYSILVFSFLEQFKQNGDDITFVVGTITYSASFDNSVLRDNSTSSTIGISDVTTDEHLSLAVAASFEHAFQNEILLGDIIIQTESIEIDPINNPGVIIYYVFLKAKNKFHIQAAAPNPSGAAVTSNAIVTNDWGGRDLLKIKGAPLSRRTVTNGSINDAEQQVDTVHFASIKAKDGSNLGIVTDPLDSKKIFDMGTSIENTSDYYAKVFFGSGDGPSKSPKHNILEPENKIIQDSINYEAVTHDNNSGIATGTSTIDSAFYDNFTLTGVSVRTISSIPTNTSVHHFGESLITEGSSGGNFVVGKTYTIVTPATGTGNSFENIGAPNNLAGTVFVATGTATGDSAAEARQHDELIGFTGASVRRMDFNTTIQPGETVNIRWAAMSFTSGQTDLPILSTSEGWMAEKADSNDDGITVKVSLDNGESYTDVSSVYEVSIDGVSQRVSSLIDGSSDSPIVKSDRYDTGGAVLKDIQLDPSNILSSTYPLMSFTVSSPTKIRFEQTNWTTKSIVYDHMWFKFLAIMIVGSNSNSLQEIPISSRGNYNENAAATSVEVRGAKYGLISPVKLNTSAVFRAGSFGNFRDMLEQRQFAKTFDGKNTSDSPVDVLFQERITKRPVTPEETNSSNLDTFCTSSLPYFDGVTRDRTTQQPDLQEKIEIDIEV